MTKSLFTSSGDLNVNIGGDVVQVDGNFIKGNVGVSSDQIHGDVNVNMDDNMPKLETRLWHIIAEPKFGAADEKVIHKAGWTTERQVNARFNDVMSQLSKYRNDNNLPGVIHFSGHGLLSRGLQMHDKKFVTGEMFAGIFGPKDKLQLITLSSCESTEVADSLTGFSRWVIAFSEKVYDSEAIKATHAFYLHLKETGDIEKSFEHAKVNIPKSAPFMFLRGLRT